MIVSALPIWIVALVAIFITSVYYLRHKNSWMSNWFVILLIFSVHFFFFAWGIIIFLIAEALRYKYKDFKK